MVRPFSKITQNNKPKENNEDSILFNFFKENQVEVDIAKEKLKKNTEFNKEENNIPSLEERVDALEEAVIDLLLVRGEEE